MISCCLEKLNALKQHDSPKVITKEKSCAKRSLCFFSVYLSENDLSVILLLVELLAAFVGTLEQ